MTERESGTPRKWPGLTVDGRTGNWEKKNWRLGDELRWHWRLAERVEEGEPLEVRQVRQGLQRAGQ